jgi:hypothetical protein
MSLVFGTAIENSPVLPHAETLICFQQQQTEFNI